MSRTTRRNKQPLIDSFVGTRDENLKDPWWRNRSRDDLTPEEIYERRVHWFTRDHRSGMFGVPNWYRREHGVFRTRRRERLALHRHTRLDCWETHAPENRQRDSQYFWW